MNTALLRSRVLDEAGIPHAFTTREGGVSSGMFASLNFGNPADLTPEQRDPPSNIAENWRRTLAAAGLDGRELVQVHQVHGAVVRIARRGGPSHETPDGRDTRADALLTDDRLRAVAVRVADCTPVLLACESGRLVGAVHAGWRGVVQGVAARAVDELRRLGAGGILAAIGPCIGPERFEIGPEVVDAFAQAFPGDEHAVVPRRTTGDKGYADLKAAIRIQLERSGVRAVDVLPGCTASDPARYFSHRASGGRCGRMAALIGPRAGGAAPDDR